MSKLVWDEIEERKFETGCDHGVLYPYVGGKYDKAVVWNGLTSVSLNPSGGEETAFYADNMKYLSLRSAEELAATVGCYFYPDEFKAYNGDSEFMPGVSIGQQRRGVFGFSYRSKIGNAAEGDDHGFMIHCIYGCTASPSERSHNTVNDSPEANEFSFEFSTTPVSVSGLNSDGKPFKPTAIVEFDSTKLSKDQIKIIEDTLYGDDENEGYMPLPDEWKELLAAG